MNIRVTGILTVQNRLLLLDQDTDSGRSWSRPGGKVEPGETLAEALIREMREETGLDVAPTRLLYVCDHLPADVVHLTFEVRRLGGTLGNRPAADTRPIRGLRFVPLPDLEKYGFSRVFRTLAETGRPGAGSYPGPKSAIGL